MSIINNDKMLPDGLEIDHELFGCQLHAFSLPHDNEFSVTYRKPSHTMYLSIGGGPVPDKLIRRTYKVIDGQLKKHSTSYGVLHPSRTVQATEEWH